LALYHFDLEHHEPVALGPGVASSVRQLPLLQAPDCKDDFGSIEIVSVAGVSTKDDRYAEIIAQRVKLYLPATA
jgi:hypothetical protein